MLCGFRGVRCGCRSVGWSSFRERLAREKVVREGGEFGGGGEGLGGRVAMV